MANRWSRPKREELKEIEVENDIRQVRWAKRKRRTDHVYSKLEKIFSMQDK